MKIVIIGPGEMRIPPKSWGAVEILIDDYRKTLQKLGNEVYIVNSKDPNVMAFVCNSIKPDVVHIQYDNHVGIAEYLDCDFIIATSHYGYLEHPQKWSSGYSDIFWGFVNSKAKIFCLSKGIKDMYKKAGVPDERLFVVPNGVRTDLFSFKSTCKFPDRSLCLGKIDFRKRQHILQDIESLWFVGNYEDNRFRKNHERWLGPWKKTELYENLTDYSNLVLLSDGEAHPLVCMEALSSGLGLVVSEAASANLDTTRDFIDVIPNEQMNNLDYIEKIIETNRKKSNSLREEIRKYAIEFHDWNFVIKNKYMNLIENLTKEGPCLT